MVMIGCAGVAGRCNNIAGCSDAPRNANLRDICATTTESYLKIRDVFTFRLASFCSRLTVRVFMSNDIFSNKMTRCTRTVEIVIDWDNYTSVNRINKNKFKLN